MNGINNNSSIDLPDFGSMTIEECLENLKFTRDFDLYLDMLNVLKDRFLIVLCVKGALDEDDYEFSPVNISEKSINKIYTLGFSNYKKERHMMYVGVSNKGSILCNNVSAEENAPVRFKRTIKETSLVALSEKNASKITINGDELSLNDTGLNFAVYDCDKSEIIEVSCFNVYEEKPEFYHRNLYFSNKYLDSHIYMPENCIEKVTLPIRRSYFSNRKLGVREVERGIFLPNKRVKGKTYGGVCDENFNFIAGHELFSPRVNNLDNRHIWGSYTVHQKDIEYIDETVVYAGAMFNHPGHLISECFADRMWWFVKNTDSSLKIAVSVFGRLSLWADDYASFVMEAYEAFGIPEDRLIFVEKPTMFKKIIIPDQSAYPLNWTFPYEYTTEYMQVFQHMTSQLTPGKDKKIYLTKKQVTRKNIIGEDYFIDFFSKRGFKIVHPEDYTLKEKAELMYGADEVVTVDSTNQIFTVFCKPTARVTILTRLCTLWNTPQQLITEAAGIKEFYMVNASGNFINNFNDNFDYFTDGLSLLCVTEEFRKYVKDVYNEELDITPEESLKNCVYEFLSYFPEYYSDPVNFTIIRNLKILDILRSMSEFFLGKEFSTEKLSLSTNEDKMVRKLQLQQKQTELDSEKIKLLTEKAAALIEENKNLKYSISRLENKTAQLGSGDNELDLLRKDNNQLYAELLAVYRQKDEADEKLMEAYRKMDEITKQLLQITEEKSALTSYIAELNNKIKELTSENK